MPCTAGPNSPCATHRKALRELANHDAGCLSLSHGKWPAFELTAEQRSDILAALRNLDAPFTDEQLIHQSLAQSNCTACHQRGESGGVTPAHSKYFTTNDQNIGQESKIRRRSRWSAPSCSGIGCRMRSPTANSCDPTCELGCQALAL